MQILYTDLVYFCGLFVFVVFCLVVFFILLGLLLRQGGVKISYQNSAGFDKTLTMFKVCCMCVLHTYLLQAAKICSSQPF